MAIRPLLAVGLAAGLMAPHAAFAVSLEEAIALAGRNNPGLAQSRAQAQAAEARLAQAKAGRLPALSVSGEARRGDADLGGFFGFGQAEVSPRAATVELRQPLFTGGAAGAAVERARQGRDAASAQVAGAEGALAAQVAQAYAGVLTAGRLLALNEAQVEQTAEVVRQAELRFGGGEIPRTDLAQAQARLAEARAGLARAAGDLARGRARFASVVGAEPDGLDPAFEPPAAPASLDDALAQAMRVSPALVAAEAQARAAEAAIRFAEAERLPSLALTATAASARDQFFPGYRADGATVGIGGRWTLFAGGLVNGRVAEARADARAARAGADAARAQVREAVIGAWEDLKTARAIVDAAEDQTAAAQVALDSVRNEVRVGQKPMLDLLDAQRALLAAQGAQLAAKGDLVVAGYRLNAHLAAD